MKDDFLNIDRIINSALKQRGWIDTLALSELFEHRIEVLGISKNQALKIMDIEHKSFDAFMLGDSPKIDYLIVLKLSTLLDMAPSVFVDKFIQKVSEENARELERTKIRLFIAKHFDLNSLRKSGLIDSVNDFDAAEKKILSFFGYNSVFEYRNNIDMPVYSAGKINSNEYSQKFWVNMAYATFEKIPNPNEYDRQELVKVFPTLRAYSLNIENGLRQVFKILYRIGITAVFIPKMNKDLHIRAATFCINEKPCVAITNYRDFYPTLWFSLFHELYHVLYDWDEISASENNIHVSAGMSSGTIDEDAANDFASRYLFDDDKLKEVEPFIDNPSFVAKFARGYNIHESIVYALYAFKHSSRDKKLFGKFNHRIIKPFSAIRSFEPIQYEKYTPIPEIAKKTMSLIN